MLKIDPTQECIFATHLQTSTPENDYHLIKEHIHHEDGTITPNIRFVKGYKRSFFVTKKGMRNHKDKKEWENINNLIRYDCVQSDLVNRVGKALGFYKDNMRMLSASPYLYGSDTTSTECIKNEYFKANPNLKSLYDIATLDIEFDVVNGSKSITIISVVTKSKVFTTVLKDFVKGYINITDKIHDGVNKYLKEYVVKRNLEVEVVILDTELDLIKACINKLHEWKPDIVAIWNISYDMGKILDVIKKEKVDPKNIFCDLKVPEKYRYFKWIEGSKKKVTSAGDESGRAPEMQWHIVETAASFQFLDAMCVFKQIRNQEPEEENYKLDTIIHRQLGIRKLNFDFADHLYGIDWHIFMQTKYKIEYIVYNMFDCICMLELDEHTVDLSIKLGMFSGVMDFDKFNSQPSKLITSFAVYAEDNGYILGTVSNRLRTDLDELTVNINKWILILSAQLRVDNGMRCINEDPNMHTLLSTHVADSDARAAYPTGQSMFNMCKETTKKERIEVAGLCEEIVREQSINLPLGQVAALEFSNFMFNFPELPSLLELYKQSKKEKEIHF